MNIALGEGIFYGFAFWKVFLLVFCQSQSIFWVTQKYLTPLIPVSGYVNFTPWGANTPLVVSGTQGKIMRYQVQSVPKMWTNLEKNRSVLRSARSTNYISVDRKNLGCKNRLKIGEGIYARRHNSLIYWNQMT